ncbi:MAG: ATP-binding protein [Methanomassiliicoccaceae archaeon]|jgi:predicted AAA+ superfamily ATPase|nr:ATP-binding protein [Methanomassiliicoccaceae archaeon]
MNEDDILIDRPMYADEIKRFIDRPFVKVIVGVRRSGKSRILKMIQKEISERTDLSHIIEMNFERSDFFGITSYIELAKYVEERIKDEKRYYVFLDEVQEVEGWEKAVNSIRLMNTDIYVTGSNSKLLDTDYSTLLGGRTINFIIYPLSFREFILFREERGVRNNSDIDGYIRFGGFPPVSMFDYSLHDARHIVTDIHSTALFRDVVKRNSVKNPQLMDKIVAFLYDNVGNLVSPSRILNYLTSQGRKGTDPETVVNYLRYLEEGFLIMRAPRYDVKGKRLLETNDKYYLTDQSLQYAVRDFRADNIQGILENIVYMELVRRGYSVYVGKLGTREIDFVAERTDGRKIYVQVCLEFSADGVYEREFAPLKEIKDNFPKYVVSMDRYAERNDGGVIGVHLKDFLQRDDDASAGN